MNINNSSLSKIVFRSVKTYFLPLTSIVGGSVFLNAEGRGFTKKQIEFKLGITSWMKDVICYNQSAVIEFGLKASHLHKALRLCFENPDRDKENIEVARQELIDFINQGFFSALTNNFAFLSEYFVQRSDEDGPRICVKGNFRTAERDTVITIFRDRKVGYKNDTEFSENSGFDHCRKTGSYYLNNDIVKSVIQDEYKNNRLDYELIDSVKGKRGTRRAFLSENWKSYWLDPGKSENSAYKSTLIIPITLWNNDLSDDFLEKINATDSDRLIFGYLCFDHPKENYFDKDTDVDIGYVVADLLSIYAFDRLKFTKYSSSFKDVDVCLGEKFNMKLSKHMVREHSKFLTNFNLAVAGENKRSIEGMSTKNKLVEIDALLAKLIAST